jgi:hypothetical protein
LIVEGKQFFKGDTKHRGDPAKEQDGDIAFTGFELGQMALGNVGLLREDLAGHAAAIPEIADAGAEANEKFLTGTLGGGVGGKVGF